MKLVELTGTVAQLQDMLEAGDLDEQQTAEAEGMLSEILDGLLPEKVDAVCWVISGLRREAVTIREAEKEMAARRQSREKRADWLQGRLRSALEAVGRDKVKAACFTVSMSDNPPAVEVLDFDAVPVGYLRMADPVVDKAAIAAVLKGGGEVPGCRLVQGRSLRIR